MELKDKTLALLASAALLLAAGAVTGGLLFYGLAAGMLAVLALDYARYRLIMRDLRLHLTVTRKLSRREVVEGSHFTVEYDLRYTGRRARALWAEQPLDSSMSALSRRKGVALKRGSQTLVFTVTPARRGTYPIPGLRLAAESWLYRGAVRSGGKDTVNIHMTLRQTQARDPQKSSLRYSSLPGSDVTRHGVGSDFASLREYTPGDSIKNVDWARSSASKTLIVRDFEDVITLPLFLLVDVDASMGTGEPETELDSAVALGTRLAGHVLLENERVGLACFSGTDVVSFRSPGSGKDQRTHVGLALSILQAAEEGAPAGRRELPALQSAVSVRKAFADSAGLEALSSLMDEAMTSLTASVREDGFCKAVLLASRTGTPCHLIVITNLSMGLASLLNGIRLARYNGHNITVALTSHLWFQPREGADAGKCFEQYHRVKEVLSRLRSLKVNVIELSPALSPEEALGGCVARGARIRG